MAENLDYLMPRETGRGVGWFIVICGGDAAEPPATATFIWPSCTPLTIHNTMVLLTVAQFADLMHRATVNDSCK